MSSSDDTQYNVCAFASPKGKVIVLASYQTRGKKGARERLSEELYKAKNPDARYKKQTFHLECKDFEFEQFRLLDEVNVVGKDGAMRVKSLLIRDHDARDPRKGYNQHA